MLNPPLGGYCKPTATADGAATGGGSSFNLFGNLLLGLAAMFMLFLGGLGLGDLHREIELLSKLSAGSTD